MSNIVKHVPLSIDPKNTTTNNYTALISHDAWELKGAVARANMQNRAKRWIQSEIDYLANTASLLDACMARRAEKKGRVSMMEALAECLDTDENRAACGTDIIKVKDLTGRKEIRGPNNSNMRGILNLASAIEVAASRGAMLNKTSSHVLGLPESKQWIKAYTDFANFLRKNESIQIHGSITEAILQLVGAQDLAAWNNTENRFSALLPAPPEPEPKDEEPDTEPDTEPEPKDEEPDTEPNTEPNTDMKQHEREPRPNMPTDNPEQQMYDAIDVIFGTSLVPQSKAILTNYLMAAAAHFNGQKVTCDDVCIALFHMLPKAKTLRAAAKMDTSKKMK